MFNKSYGYEINADDLKDIKRICVLCWGLLGDVFMRVHIVGALKRRFPTAEIIVITDPGGTKAFNNNESADRLLVVTRKKKPISKYLGSMIGSIVKLRQQHIDLCVNLYSGGSSAAYSYFTGARIRLGFDHTKSLRRFNNLLVKKDAMCGKWVRGLAETLRPLGIDPESIIVGTTYTMKPQSIDAAREFLVKYKNKKIIYNLGSRDPNKNWSVTNFVELAKKMHANYAVVPVILNSPGQEELMQEFAQAYQQYSDEILLLPKLDFDIEAAIVSGVDILMSADSSLLHLAAGVKTPIVGIYFLTRPENTAPTNVPCLPIYIEKSTGVDDCGYPLLERNIPVMYVFNKLSNFVEQQLGWKNC